MSMLSFFYTRISKVINYMTNTIFILNLGTEAAVHRSDVPHKRYSLKNFEYSQQNTCV